MIASWKHNIDHGKSNIWIRRAGLLLILAFYLFLAFQVPYTHDDWDWGLPVGMERWLHASVNSRYVGNFFAVVLTRFVFVKTIVLGVTFFAIPYLITKIACRDKALFYPVFLLSNLLILAMPRSIWQQTYGWVSGFSNYVMSACFFLLYLWLIRGVFEQGKPKYGRAAAFLAAPLCISLQLFIENLTVFNILFSLFILLYAFLAGKQVAPIHLIAFFSFLFGSIFMFSNSLFLSLFETGRALFGIRCLTYNPGDSVPVVLSKLFDRYIMDFSVMLFENNWVLCIMMALLCLGLIARRGKHTFAAGRIFPSVLAGYTIFCLIRKIFPAWVIVSDERLNALLFALISGLFFVTVCLCVLLYLDDPMQKGKLLAFLMSAPAVILPLLIVDTIGPRLFFTSNLFMVLFCATLTPVLLSKNHSFALRINRVLIPALALLIIHFGGIYQDIGRNDRLRGHIIEQSAAAGAKIIILPTDSHRNYWWGLNPTANWRLDCFKEFYGIPAETLVGFE